MSSKSDSTDFNDLAAIYERLGEPMTHGIGVQMLDMLRLKPGQQLIDVAAGSGALAVEAAERGLHVLATDIAPAMVARAVERLRLFPDCGAKAMSFDRLDVPDASFDAAVSTFGILAFATWHKGLAELVRVTRSGGYIAASMWTTGRDATPAYLMKRIFEDCFPGRELWSADFFPHWTLKKLEDSLNEAGCDEVCARICRAEWSPISSDGMSIGPDEILDDADVLFRNFPGYRDLNDAEREKLREPIANAFGAYTGQDGVVRMQVEAFAVVGRRP